MAGRAADAAVVEQIAEEFLKLHRQGKRPSVDEFCDRYPQHADELRGFLPALVAVEFLKPNSVEGSGPIAGTTEIGGKQLERLGDYRILGEVGRGGMGIVYEAEQESLGRRVALKVLAQHLLSEPRQVKRFLREARAAARLHHTNIVPVFGVGQQNGNHYYVMQFIQGLGLDEVLDELRRMDMQDNQQPIGNGEHAMSAVDVARSILKERRGVDPDRPPDDPAESQEMATVITSDASTSTSVVMPGKTELSEVHESEKRYWDGVARIGIQVAEALEYAHEQGTLHRDIKPSNLLLDGHGQVWVTDFGLAKVAEADDLTHTGDILGTIRYMAPERFHGHCDARTDIYSLGITLYELLARRPAYLDPAREQLIKRIESEPPTPLSKTTPGIPRDLETIVNKAIEKDPAHRYRTAQALADDLQRFVNDEPIHARRISMRERLVRWSRRNPVVAGSVSVAAVALMAIAVVSALLASSQRRLAESEKDSADKVRGLLADREDAITDLKTALDGIEQANERLEAAKRESQIESARLALEKGNNLLNQGDAQTALAWYSRALSRVEGNPDAAELETFIRRGIAAAKSYLFPLVPFRMPLVENFEVSPDGRFIVTRKSVTEEVPASKTETTQRGAFGRPNVPNEFTLWDTASGRRLWTTQFPPGQNGIDFSHDGRFLLVGAMPFQGALSFGGRATFGRSGSLPSELYDLNEADAPPREIELPAEFGVVGLSENGATVYGVSRGTSVSESGEEEVFLRVSQFEIETGRETAFTHELRRPAPTDAPGRGQGLGLSNVMLARMSAGGKWLFTAIDHADFQIWQLDDPSTAPREFDIAQVSFGRFTPDERHLLIGVNSLLGVNSTAGAIERRSRRADEIRYLALDDGEAEWSEEVVAGGRDCSFSPDGGLLALIESDDDRLGQSRLTIRSTADGRLLQAMAIPRAVGSLSLRTAGSSVSGRQGLQFYRQGRSLLLHTNQGVRQFDLPQSSLQAAVAPRADARAAIDFIHGGDAIAVCWTDRQEVYGLPGGDAQFTEHSGSDGLVSEDGRIVTVTKARGLQNAVLQILERESGTLIHEFPLFRRGGVNAPNLGVSSDRRHFVTADPSAPAPERGNRTGPGLFNVRRAVRIHDSRSGNVLATVNLRVNGYWRVSPEATWLAQWSTSAPLGMQLELMNLQTGVSRELLVGDGEIAQGLAFTGDERWMVLATGARLVLFDLSDPELEQVLFDSSASIRDMALLPDNRSILTLENDAVVRVWDIETGHSFSLALDCASAPTRIAVSPDGARLATFHPVTNGPRVRVWMMPAPVEGTAEEVRMSVAQETGTVLDGRGVRELTFEELGDNGAPDDRAPDDLERWHEVRAIDAIDQANWGPALWHLKRWADERPDDPTPRAWTAYCHYQRQDMAATLDALAQTRERTRGREKSFTSLVPLLLNIVLVSRVPNEQALPHLDYQLQLDPGSTRSRWLRSLAFANMRRWDEAIPNLEQVVERWLDNYTRQRDLVAYYLQAGGHEGALRQHIEGMLGYWESSNDAEGQASAALAGLIVPLDPDLTERAALLAQQASRGTGRGGSGAPVGLVEIVFRLFDTDEDGELSPAEQKRMPGTGRLAAMGIGLDGEKSVTREDLTAMIERSGGAGSFSPNRTFDDYDRDGDGEISPEEQKALPARLVANLGIEPDAAKSVTRDEFTAAQEPAQRSVADQIFDRADSNGDGELTPAEQRNLPERTVATLGIDLDAAKPLTREEFRAVWERERANRESQGFPFGGPRGQFGGRGGQFGGFGGGTASVLVQLAGGIAAYRRGDLDEATRRLDSARDLLIASRDANLTSDPDSTAEPAENARLALVHLFLAMTEHQRENADAAGEQMENARALLDAHVDDPTTYDPNLEWWIFAREVLKEAETTLNAG